MRFFSYLNTAKKLLLQYDGAIPLSAFLKQYFSLEKKHGSKDRKHIAHFCYCYFRLGKTLSDIDIEEKMKTALFLCSDNLEQYSALFDSSWNTYSSCSLQEKIAFIQSIYPLLNTKDILSFTEELSPEIDVVDFSLSHLIQPDLFIRIRPGKKENVFKTLHTQGVDFIEENESCIRLANTTSVNNILAIDKDVVIQDLSSQKIASLLQKAGTLLSNTTTLKVWDCCAASGGKSILVKDIFQNIQLTVSDTRQSIMANLLKRFASAGITKYQHFVADLTAPPKQVPLSPFDLVICDAPCSGSGTWGRTPEQLSFFDKTFLEKYIRLQKTIAVNTAQHVKKDGCFLYITCSVFKKENEDVVDHILQKTSLELVEQGVIKGYDKKADSMFAALFISRGDRSDFAAQR